MMKNILLSLISACPRVFDIQHHHPKKSRAAVPKRPKKHVHEFSPDITLTFPAIGVDQSCQVTESCRHKAKFP